MASEIYSGSLRVKRHIRRNLGMKGKNGEDAFWEMTKIVEL